MSNLLTPTYLNAYLVAGNSGTPLGAVRRHGNVWRIYLFGIGSQEQPREAFATRAEAGVRLLELAPPES